MPLLNLPSELLLLVAGNLQRAKGVLSLCMTNHRFYTVLAPPLANNMLCCGVRRTDEKLVRTALQKGANMYTEPNCNCTYTALSLAASASSTILLLLLASDPNAVKTLNFKCRGVGMPLHAAACCGNLENIGILLDRGADITARSTSGGMAVHWATSLGSAIRTNALLDRGCPIEARDMKGNTPLHWAANRGRGPMARVLVERGADMAARNKDGYIPPRLGVSREHDEGWGTPGKGRLG